MKLPAATPDKQYIIHESLQEFLSPQKVKKAGLYRIKENQEMAESASKKAWDYLIRRIPFDKDFDLSTEDSLYCTELIWLSYKYAGIDLVSGEFDAIHYSINHRKILLPSTLSNSLYLTKISSIKYSGP